MSEKAQGTADAIARYLKLNGARTTASQIVAIRRVYGQAWKRHLTYVGNGALSVDDVADGVDLLLSPACLTWRRPNTRRPWPHPAVLA